MRLLIAVCILFAVLACCAPGRAWGQSLVLGTDEWPPYEFTSHDEVRGIATDVLMAVFRRMGVTVAGIGRFPWARGLHMLEGGGLDVLYSGIYDPERLAFARYHEEPLVVSNWVIFARKGEGHAYASAADLKGHSLGVVRGYSYTPEVNAIITGNKHVVRTSSDADNLKLLVHGRVEYALCDELNCRYLVGRLGLEDTVAQVPGPSLARISIYALFSRQRVSEAFVQRFDETLRAFKADRAYEAILRKYLR